MIKGYSIQSLGVTVVLVLAAIVAVLQFSQGLTTIPCWTDCGETFNALSQVQQFKRFGFSYALLEDLATSGDPQAHPYLYTHNVNLGAILFSLAAAVGITEPAQLHLITLAAFSLGLFYAFALVKRVTQSELLGLLVLGFLASDLVHVLWYGLNALRAWHFLAIFGLIYHVFDWTKVWTGGAPPLRQTALVVLFTLIAFGVGYDFWIILFFIGALVVLVFSEVLAIVRFKRAFLLGCLFLIPFLFRQVQVAAGVGLEFWWYDFFVTIAIKVPYVSHLVELPSLADIDAVYRESAVARPPASPSNSWQQILYLLEKLTRYKFLPSYGLLSLILLFSPLILWGGLRLKALRGAKDKSGSAWAGLWRMDVSKGRILQAVSMLEALPLFIAVAISALVLAYTFYDSLPRSVGLSVIAMPVLLAAAGMLPMRLGKLLMVSAALGPVLTSLSAVLRVPNIPETQIVFFIALAVVIAGSVVYVIWSGAEARREAAAFSFWLLIPFALISVYLFDQYMMFLLVVVLAFVGVICMTRGIAGVRWIATLPALGTGFVILNAAFIQYTPYVEINSYQRPYQDVLSVLALVTLAAGAMIAVFPDFRLIFAGTVTRWFDKTGGAPTTNTEAVEDDLETSAPITRALTLFGTMAVGTVAGLAFFAPLSLHIYIKHEFPLVIILVCLSKAIVLYALYLVWRSAHSRTVILRGAVAVFALFILLDHAIIQRAGASKDDISTSWTKALPELSNATIVTSWIAQGTDAFINGASVALPPGKETVIAARVEAGEQPFTVDDYFIFGQRDWKVNREKYEFPDYWLYFQSDVLSNFDRPEPTCEADYLTSLFSKIRGRFGSPINPALTVQTPALPGPYAPGSRLGLYGVLDVDQKQLKRVFLRAKGVRETSMTFNCIYNSFSGGITIPPNFADELYQINFFIETVDGREVYLRTLEVPMDVSGNHYTESDTFYWERENQPSPEELAERLGIAPVAQSAGKWAIFDMREIYDRSSSTIK